MMFARGEERWLRQSHAENGCNIHDRRFIVDSGHQAFELRARERQVIARKRMTKRNIVLCSGIDIELVKS